jgi:hypothetical protein
MTNSSRSGQRSVYQRPELAVFGSVRNLTGGSMGKMGDAKANMA